MRALGHAYPGTNQIWQAHSNDFLPICFWIEKNYLKYHQCWSSLYRKALWKSYDVFMKLIHPFLTKIISRHIFAKQHVPWHLINFWSSVYMYVFTIFPWFIPYQSPSSCTTCTLHDLSRLGTVLGNRFIVTEIGKYGR